MHICDIALKQQPKLKPRSQAPTPQGEAWYTLFAHVRKYPQFLGDYKIAYTYQTLVTYTNSACSFYANKEESGCSSGLFTAC